MSFYNIMRPEVVPRSTQEQQFQFDPGRLKQIRTTPSPLAKFWLSRVIIFLVTLVVFVASILALVADHIQGFIQAFCFLFAYILFAHIWKRNWWFKEENISPRRVAWFALSLVIACITFVLGAFTITFLIVRILDSMSISSRLYYTFPEDCLDGKPNCCRVSDDALCFSQKSHYSLPILNLTGFETVEILDASAEYFRETERFSTEIYRNETSGFLQVKILSNVIGFPHDVWIQINEYENQQVELFCQMKAGLGISDKGINAKRMERYLDKLPELIGSG